MKLLVEKGELTLPSDFSFEIEHNSAFFSEEGSQSVPATIPATPDDQAKLGHPTRLGRARRFVNAFPAQLQHGTFQMNGTLLVTSADRDSFTCSLAVENSDFYARCKDQKLRELFSSIVREDYSTPAGWAAYLFDVYTLEEDDDFRLFPVAVGTEDDLQLNNEPVQTSGSDIWPLAWQRRIIREGDKDVEVPDGYGLAPFLKLPSFLEYIFILNGYTVSQNCFRTDARLQNLMLLHSCSDVICNGKIRYADLVPDKTVGEIIEWLGQKFHVQIIVDNIGRTVRIEELETLIRQPSATDMTGKVIGKAKYSFSRSSRVVYKPNTQLAPPPQLTLQELISKYGSIMLVNEPQYAAINYPCVCYRLSTGEIEEIFPVFEKTSFADHDEGSMNYGRRTIGSNHFTYDRDNSESSETFSPEDTVPAMVFHFPYGILAPFVGERSHRNTSYNGETEETEQEIIIADYAGRSTGTATSETEGNSGTGTGHGGRLPITAAGKYFYATTQKYDNRGAVRSGRISLTPEDIVSAFFSGYNRHLLNCAVEVSAEFDLTVPELMRYDLYSMKTLDSQKMLPTYIRFGVGKQTRCLEARLRLFKEYSDGIDDEPVTIPQPTARWSINRTAITTRQAALQAEHPDGTVLYYYSAEDPRVAGEEEIHILPPLEPGLESEHYDVLVHFFLRKQEHAGSHDYDLTDETLSIWFDSVQILS